MTASAHLLLDALTPHPRDGAADRLPAAPEGKSPHPEHAPLTSEPPIAATTPLTSEPPYTGALPLTSEPTAPAVGQDPSVV
ncbi:hypothetical protein ACFWIA_11915 [Streptomyces sp. NPDC127068]|uniref:hypothetical protein n=1 Tax=Streptomyces sp. NPDC127068 TaxID=3347127 RepID=UPI003651864A